jgi:hypothetical protein
MYNLRYHLASLVAVFLALTVGLVLGSVVAERGTLGDQSSTLAGDLQKQFDQIQKDNADMRTGLERDRTFAKDVVPALTADALADKTVAVLVNAGRTSGLNSTLSAIREAGGTPLILTFESAYLGLDTEVPGALPALLGEQYEGQTTAPAGQAFIDAVSEAMASELKTAAPRPILDVLVKSGVVTIGESSTGGGIDACVVMSTFDGEPDPFALAVARGLENRTTIVVGAEAAALKTGVALSSVDEGFSAVDDVESPQGMLSLVWILSGRASGYFGVGSGAEALYPALDVGSN